MAKPTDLPVDVRKEIASDLASWVNASDASKGTMTEWWRVCQRVHLAQEGEVFGSGEDGDDSWEVTHRPLSGPRQDTLTAQITGVIARQNPLMLDTSDDRMLAAAKNETIHRIWTDAKFKMRLRAACDIAVDTDLAYLRFCPLGKGRIEIQVIHPDDIAVFPALPSGQSVATFVGHRIEKPRRYVLARRAKGDYYKDDGEVAPSGGKQGQDVAREISGANPTGAAGPHAALDKPVEIWDAIVRIDLKSYGEFFDDETYTGDGERLYRVSFSRTDVQLLHLEPYTLDESWYVEFRIIGGLPYWPVRSVGRIMLGLQSEYNNLWSLNYRAIAAAAGPPVFGPSPDQKFTTYGSFALIDSDQPATSYFSPTVRAEVSTIPEMLRYIESIADATSGISKNMAGGDVAQQTATEAQIVASGAAVTLEDKIEKFGEGLEIAARITEAIVFADWDEFAARFSLEDEEPDPLPSDSPDPDDPATTTDLGQAFGSPPPGAPQAPPDIPQAIPPGGSNPLAALLAGMAHGANQ